MEEVDPIVVKTEPTMKTVVKIMDMGLFVVPMEP
jgi:hypothetical protein